MSLLTIILFFVYLWGFGFTVLSFLKLPEHWIDRNIARLGVGLGLFPLIGVILNFLGIPLDWKIFFAIAVIPAGIILYLQRKDIKLPQLRAKLKKKDILYAILIIIFLFTFYMYHKGAFTYPYLEDDDPYGHAMSIKYVSIEKTAFEPYSNKNIFQYIDPYPPGYDIVMGVLHQTSESLIWTMKFFNALIISLGILFFFIFMRSFTGSLNKALFSTFVLAMVPSYLTHFIWAHALIITLFFPAMYCVDRIREEKKWFIPSLLLVAGIALIQPTQAIKLIIMVFGYMVIKDILNRKITPEYYYSFFGGILLSMVWWYNKWKGMFFEGAKGHISEGVINPTLWQRIKSAFPYDGGTATRAYNFNDFFIAKPQGLINNSVGLGIVISILLVLALIYIIIKNKSLLEQKNHWMIIALAWLLFTFLGMNSMTFKLPIGLFAFRFWMLFAICVAIISSEGLYFLFALFKQFKVNHLIILVLVVITVWFTAGTQKFAVNTSMWPPGIGWTSMDEVMGYVWLKDLPVDTKVYDFSGRYAMVIAFDKFECGWCESNLMFREGILYKDVPTIHSFLKSKGFEYFILGGRSYKYLSADFGENETQRILPGRIEEITSSGLFQPVHQTKGMVVFKVI